MKVTGDGTWIGKRLHIVTFGFTLLEEGSAAKSSCGNHSVCLLKQSEDYPSLALGLRDIRDEITEISSNGISVLGKKFDVHFYLGGDWKFIAAVCGLDAANSTFSCIWCKCAKNQRHSLEMQWSIIDEEQGARTTQAIIDASKLPKRSTSRYNVSHEPLFTSIPMHRVIPDNLHMFLRIGDVLINLLVTELRRQDGIDKCKLLDRNKARHVSVYEKYLNEACKIPFQFYICKDSNTLKWRDLTGPEKYRLFSKVDWPSIFPQLPNVETVQQIWQQFFQLINTVRADSITAEEIDNFEAEGKTWLSLFLSIYQTKNVTSYMHLMVAHLPEFLRIHGSISPFTQQGLEKLNDVYTQFYFRGSNHRELEALKQILLRKNRVEFLTDSGYEREKRTSMCSLCSQPGHNKRTCTLANAPSSSSDRAI